MERWKLRQESLTCVVLEEAWPRPPGLGPGEAGAYRPGPLPPWLSGQARCRGGVCTQWARAWLLFWQESRVPALSK